MEVFMAMKQEKVLIRDGYDIGIGVASATGSPMALGAIGQVTPPQIGKGGSGSFTFRRIDSNEELEHELDIGADVSAGIGLFSGSASFDFSKQCKIQSSSLTVLVSAKETFAFEQMDSPELTPAAARLVEQGQTTHFSAQFGEYFVRGISSGGRFTGVVRIDTRSKQSKMDVDAALSGSYGLTMSAEARLHLSDTLKSANAKIEAFYIFDGGIVKTRLTSNDPVELVNQLYTAMDEWTATVRENPKAYSVTLAPYIIALGPNPPNIADFEHQRDVLIRCAKLRSQTLDKLNLIDFILDPNHMNEFAIIPPPDGPDLPDVQARLAGDLDVIADAASFAINNIKESCDPVTFMREVRGVTDFKLTALPLNLPEHTGGAVVVVPAPPANLFVIPNWQTMADVDDLGGILNIMVEGVVDHTQAEGTIVLITPPPGTSITVESLIVIQTVKNFAVDGATGQPIPL
jgi:hypothetical protein